MSDHPQDHAAIASEPALHLPPIDEAAALLDAAQHVSILTGAGISKESGIDTFRDEGGLWDTFDLQTFGTPGGLSALLATEPHRLAAFIAAILTPIANASPNAGHRALAALEDTHDVSVITQNVDGLHQRAGSTLVREIHGSFDRIVDIRGRTLRRLKPAELKKVATAVAAATSGRFARFRLMRAVRPMLGLSPTKGLGHRPNLVLFGESLAEPDWAHAQDDVADCDALLLIGTSAQVYPAAALPEIVQSRRRPVIGVGPEPGDADIWLEGTATTILPALVDAIRVRRGLSAPQSRPADARQP